MHSATSRDVRVSVDATLQQLTRIAGTHRKHLDDVGLNLNDLWAASGGKDSEQAYLRSLRAGLRAAYRLKGMEVDVDALIDDAARSAGTLAPIVLWNRAKVVYDVDPVLAQELADTLPEGQLPKDLFDRLPHTDPLIVWTVPPAVTCGNGAPGRLRAALVHGRVGGNGVGPCSTQAPERGQLRILFILDVLDETGAVVDIETSTSSLPTDATTISELVLLMSSRHIGDSTFGRNKARLTVLADNPDVHVVDATILQHLTSVIKYTLPVLLYACSDSADVVTPPARSGTKPKGGRGGRPRPVRIHRIGHRIGPALDQARRQYARREQGGGHGSSRSPHPRRAHWHTYWVGSGPKEQKTKILRWVHLILVKATIMDTATVVQVKG